MDTSSDLGRRAEEIRTLIASDQLEHAIKRLMDFASDFADRERIREVIVLSASYTRIEKLERQEKLNFDEAERHRRKILHQALELLDNVEARPTVRAA